MFARSKVSSHAERIDSTVLKQLKASSGSGLKPSASFLVFSTFFGYWEEINNPWVSSVPSI